MKMRTRIVSILLFTAMLVGLLPTFASALSISDSGFTKIGSIPNDYVATQGMCTDGKYIYTFKMISGNNNQARFYRTSISTGETVLMRATFDTSLTNFLALGHGNDMCAVVHNGVTYLYLATMYDRSHSEFQTHSIWKFKVTGSNLEKVAYYDVIEYGTDDMDFTGLTVYKQTDTHVTLMSADGKYIYTIELGLDQPSGTVDCKWVFTINYATAPTPTGAPTYRFKDSNGNSYYGVQGMTYDNGKLYYVLTGSQTTSTAKDNYIFCYDVENFTNKNSVEAIAAESIYVTSSYYQFFLEFESIDIHDGVMYFSANAGKYGYYEDYDFCGKLKKTFETTPEYTVTFCNEDGSTLQSVKVKQGSDAKYTGTTPTKAYDNDSHYTFSGWLSSVGGSAADLSNVQGNMKVYAGFTSEGHKYTPEVVTAPNCTREGSQIFRCACGYNYTDPIAMEPHSPMLVDQKDATCTEEGYTGDLICLVCETLLEKGTVTPVGEHSPVFDPGYAPTCETAGLTDGSYCGDCGILLQSKEPIPATGHIPVTCSGYAPTCLSSGISDGQNCVTCGAVLRAQEVLPRLGHSYSYTYDAQTHVGTCIRCEKQITQPHSFTNGSCVCGAGVTIEDPNLRISHNLNLASDIAVNFVVAKSALVGYDMDTVYLECAVDSYEGDRFVGVQTSKILPVEQGNYYYFTLKGLTAVRMNDSISSVLYGNKDGVAYVSTEDIYTVAQYAYAQLNKSNVSPTLKTLCADLLRYGAAAQSYKGYRTDAPADGAMTEEHRAYLSDLEGVEFGDVNTVLDDLQSPKVSWVGKTLNLESKVVMKYVFSAADYSGELSELELRISYTNISGETVTMTVSDTEVYNEGKQQYAFSFDGLLAAELRRVLSARIYAGEEPVSVTMVYSPDTYGKGKTGSLGDLCKALFAYSDSAKLFFVN
ncbi:MAG: hypothetical protein IKT58_06340 [Oscillospiraceae bacterium]|nr:hypothetical protein [Oscillospiraceae bacterium]